MVIVSNFIESSIRVKRSQNDSMASNARNRTRWKFDYFLIDVCCDLCAPPFFCREINCFGELCVNDP